MVWRGCSGSQIYFSMATLLNRFLSHTVRRTNSPSLSLSCTRPFSTSSFPSPPPTPPPEKANGFTPTSRTKTPLETQFEEWVHKLRPGFTAVEVEEALRAQSDPDLALDIFRWTGQQRRFKHNHLTYLTIIEILVYGKRYKHAETLVEEVIAGACEASVPLYNAIIKFCCGRKMLFKRAFDVYKKMWNSRDCKPNLETYSLLFNALLRRFNKFNVCFIYLHSVRSLTKQMKACGVIPDTFVLNMIIRAYSKCLEVDEAIRWFREMGLYGCEPNAYSYSYITRGLCEKGRVSQGVGFYKEMRNKGLLPSSSTYMIIICSVALEGQFEEAVEVMFDMLTNSMSPDLLTYKTVLEELCRRGRDSEAFRLLDELRRRDVAMNERTYRTLLDGLHFMGRE